ncbi:MAG TPA: hypothetical protein VNW97_22840 [Candidatus Saccharimonadales bacterium]|jgi:hypothetical protein|nr:hypothetical protein [Candidatus Saccharimonadales bacterium]
MRPIGFSTGALALSNVREALRMLAETKCNAVELSALRQSELLPLVEQIDDLDLGQFAHISFHAPSSIDRAFESTAITLLTKVYARGWPIIVHPDAMHTVGEWSHFGNLLCIENMDKRKPIGQTASDLASIFEQFPEASLCMDLGHARQVDPTMSEATAILVRFGNKLKQLHVSEVNSQSRHDPLTLEATMAFHRVAQLIPGGIPVILESRVEESAIEYEIAAALAALDPTRTLVVAGD